MDLKRVDVQYLEGDEIPPACLTRAAVEDYAGQVARIAGFRVGDPLEPMVRQMGGRIDFKDISWILEERSGAVYVHATRDFDVILPRFTSPRRDRFTIAHELGHYFIHARQGNTPIVAYRQGTGLRECEANWFAAGLLMPAPQFRKCWGQLGDREGVAEKFGMSVEAVEVRAKSLGLHCV